MTKDELLTKIADATGASKADVERFTTSFAGVVTDALKNGDDVSLPGLGKLRASERAARTGRNPATGEEINIPAKTVAKFKAAKALEDALN